MTEAWRFLDFKAQKMDKAPNLVPLYQQAQELLSGFGSVTVTWQPRQQSVAILGH
jgi:hypothetical protein